MRKNKTFLSAIMSKTLNHPFLQQMRTDLQEVVKAIKESFGGLSQQDFNWKPAPDKWSIAECMKHLLIVYSKYQPQLPQKITPHAPKNIKNTGYKSTFMGRLFKSFVNPAKKGKTSAPKSLQPPSQSKYPLSLQLDFIEYLEEVIRFIEKTDELAIDLNKIKLKSSVTGFIRFNLGDYFEIESMHSRLHLVQMQRVKQTMKEGR